MAFENLPFWVQGIFMALFVLLFDSIFHLGITALLAQFLFVGGIVMFFVLVIVMSLGLELFKRLGLLTSTGSGMRTSYRFRR